MIDDLIDSIAQFFYGILYSIQSSICYLIDFIKEIFYKLCGIETVLINGEKQDLVSSLLLSKTIHQIFLAIMLISVILLFIFVIIAIIRSNYQANEKKGKGAILGKAGQAFLLFLLIPFLLLAGITLVNTVMSAINSSMQIYLGNGSSIGGQMLITTGQQAFFGKSKEEIERMFLTGQLDYTNLSIVKNYYDITKINYLVGILGGIVILVMFVLSSITFIQRIFDIILLYIISPVSISTIPLDDGNRFRLWKDMLISKILGAYGIILVMNLFFLIIPQVNQMRFFDNDFQNGVVYVLFLIGGAFAVTKANLVISQLCGSQSGGRELAQMIYNFRSGMAFGKSVTNGVGGLLGRAVGGTDYLNNRQKGSGRIESMNLSLHSTRNQKVVNDSAKKSKAKQYAGIPTRLATMPAGTLKDLVQGGTVQAGKNFIPRLKNIANGNTMLNRAEVKPTNIEEKNTNSFVETKSKDVETKINTESTRIEEKNGEVNNENNTKK